MPTLQVRDLPERLYKRLSEEASKARRSLTQQAIVTLQKGLEMEEDAPTRRRRLLSEIEDSEPIDGTDEFADPAEVIGEDRRR